MDHEVQFDNKRKTLPGLESHAKLPETVTCPFGSAWYRCCMVAVSSCRKTFPSVG